MTKSHPISICARARLLTALLIVAGAATPVIAQQTTPLQSYDVELVIFRTSVPTATAEQWSLEAAAAGQRLAIPDDEPTPFATTPAAPAVTVSFPALAAAKLKLTGAEDALRRSRNYQPLAHVGWTQPGYPRDAAKFLSLGSLVSASSGLVGQVALSRGRYLHLTLDLVYDAPTTDAEPAQRYVLRQTRRMRSNEWHYIDHPKFGVIALITPSTL
jgi:hypothetical protein